MLWIWICLDLGNICKLNAQTLRHFGNKGAVKCQVYNVWNVKPILKCFVWQNIIMFANKWISNIRTTLTDWLYYYWQQAYICALNVPDLTYVHLKLARFSQMNYICWRHELLVAIEGKTYFWTQMLGIFNDRLLLWSQLKSPLRQPRSHSVLWASAGQQEIILGQFFANRYELKGKRDVL